MDDAIYDKLKEAVEELCYRITTLSGVKLKIRDYHNGNFAVNFLPRQIFLYANIFVTKNQIHQRPLSALSEKDIVQFVKKHSGNNTLVNVPCDDLFKRESFDKLVKLVVLFVNELNASEEIQAQLKLEKELRKEYGNPYVGDNLRERVGGFDGPLRYRIIAKKLIYDRNPEKYPLPFSKYEVHHINGDKTDDDVRNLKLVTKEEHQQIHGRTW